MSRARWTNAQLAAKQSGTKRTTKKRPTGEAAEKLFKTTREDYTQMAAEGSTVESRMQSKRKEE